MSKLFKIAKLPACQDAVLIYVKLYAFLAFPPALPACVLPSSNLSVSLNLTDLLRRMTVSAQ